MVSRRLAVAVLMATGAAAMLASGKALLDQPQVGLGVVPRDPYGIVAAAGHGWTAAGLNGPVPLPGSCHLLYGGSGEPLPDPHCTPGAVDVAVQGGNLRSTVCRPGGYTASVRPPEAITEAAKRVVMAAYGIPWSQASRYELDHLVELNAGGSSDWRNLWPEPNVFLNGTTGSAFVHNDKDQVEAYLSAFLCKGEVSLSTVQRAMATDWTTAVARLGLAPIPRGYVG